MVLEKKRLKKFSTPPGNRRSFDKMPHYGMTKRWIFLNYPPVKILISRRILLIFRDSALKIYPNLLMVLT
jgi:hypothetical protein